MQPIIDHIQITVRDLETAEAFYDRLMPVLGFDLRHKHKGRVPAHEFEVVEYCHNRLIFALTSPRAPFRDEPIHRRKPGAVHHIAFQAQSPEEVDGLYPLILAAGAQIVEPPRFYPQHGPRYYALFFKDPEGIKYEIVHDVRHFD